MEGDPVVVNRNKIRKHLPGLLIDGPTSGNDAEYQKVRWKLNQMERNEPIKFNSFLDRLDFALNNFDIYFDEKGELEPNSKLNIINNYLSLLHITVNFDANSGFLRRK